MRIFIHTFGCTLNQSDSELMAGLLDCAGHKVVASESDAELIIFNTCTVKDRPEKSFYAKLEKAISAEKKVIVAGCVSQADSANPKLKNVSIIGVRHISQITEAVEAACKGQIMKLLDFGKNQRLNLPKIRKNPVVEIIPISAGCLGECTFCKTRFARGSLYSYEPKDIKRQMEAAIINGAKEVWLTSQDCGAYGRDIGSSLPELLDDLVNIPGEYRVRLGMINPNHAGEMIRGLVSFLNNEKAFKFVHIPLQSASDIVLKTMNRRYSATEFENIVTSLRDKVPGLTIATDIIAGFPGESEADHQKTASLLEKLKMPVVNLTKFYPRPGTAAAKMKLHPTKLVKARSTKLMELQKKLIDNREWIGWTGSIIIDEIGKDNSVIGRNDYYKPVALKNSRLQLGDRCMVIIMESHQHHLVGEQIKDI
jgi:threonylcarbamoyladenosine tRNA methylthiotransferase CDKAL1